MVVDALTRSLLERHLDEVDTFGRRINLSTVPRADAWRRHVEESLHLLARLAPPRAARLVDLGSGAGFPGVPIAVVRRDLEVVLCDADQRRCAFLRHVVGLLGLERVRVVGSRAEELGRDPAEREMYDVVVSRATAPPAVLCELALPLLRVGGRLGALVANAPAAATAARAAALTCGGAPPLALAGDVLAVTKQAPSPERYPRRPGVAARAPLA